MINLIFGSNLLIGTDIPIIFREGGEDTELLRYSLRTSDSKPLMDVEIRDSAGELLGKVWKSTSFVVVHKDYEEKTEYEGSEVKKLMLEKKTDKSLVFELIFHTPNNVEVNGIFHIKGYPHSIIATKDCLTIGGLSFSHNTIHKRGMGLILSRNGFSV